MLTTLNMYVQRMEAVKQVGLLSNQGSHGHHVFTLVAVYLL